MKTSYVVAAAVLALGSAGSAYAQAAPLVVGAPASNMLHVGYEIPMRTLVELTTLKKGLTVGQRVPLEVAEPVMINGQTVIPAGTPGMGEITAVRNKGMWGKSGSFAGRVIYIRVGDRQIRMTGTFDDKGHAGGGAAVATSALVFLPAGFFMTGTSAKLASGTPVSAFLDEDVPVQFAQSAAPTPLVVTNTPPRETAPSKFVVPVDASQGKVTSVTLVKAEH